MLSRPICFASLLIGLSLGLQAPCVFGQYIPGRTPATPLNPHGMNPQMMMQQGPQQVNVDGTIASIASGTIMVTDKTSMAWKVTIPSEAKVHVTGTATVEYLQSHPKLTVEFKADFDNQGAIKEKVSELTLVSPKDEKAGVVAEADAGNAATDDAAGAIPGKSAKSHTTASKTAAKSGAVHGTPPAGPCHVVGKLSYKGDEFFVQIHGMTHSIKLPLADDVTVKVDMADISQAAAGDNITVSGMGTHPKVMMNARGVGGAPGMVQASDVKIEMAEQLTGVKKRTSAAKSASHPKKDKEE